MANGLAGDSGVAALGGDPAADLTVVELRVIANLLQQSGIAAGEDLNTWRNDIGLSLGLPNPNVPSL
jgi:hypothetical protein